MEGPQKFRGVWKIHPRHSIGSHFCHNLTRQSENVHVGPRLRTHTPNQAASEKWYFCYVGPSTSTWTMQPDANARLRNSQVGPPSYVTQT
jgi:hypothetical protein